MNQRQKQINEFIQLKQEASLGELKQLAADVSEMTIRRDLEMLEHDGLIVRVHGGAKSVRSINNMLVEDVFSKRLAINADRKQTIASKAATLIEPGKSIYLDAGSTVLALARIISDDELLITTSGLNIAPELLHHKSVKVNVTGGEVNPSSISISGPQAIASISNLNIDVAFIAATAFSRESGFTCGSINDRELKSYVLKKARKRVLLMDSTKLDSAMPYTFAHATDIDIFVSDGRLPERICDFLSNNHVNIL